MTKIRAAGGRVIEEVALVTLGDLAKEESQVRTVQEMVDFNKAHAKICLPPGSFKWLTAYLWTAPCGLATP
jgi:hypothetical protein